MQWTAIPLAHAVAAGVLGEPTKIVDANELMWEFFAKHPLPKR